MLRVVSLLVLLAGSSASKWEYSVELISKAPYPALSLNNAIGAGHSPCKFVFNPAYIPPDATHSVGMLVVRVSQCPPDYGGSGDHLSWAPCDVAAGTCGDLVPGVGFPFPGGAEDPRIFQLTDADGKLWTYMYMFAAGPGQSTVYLRKTLTPWDLTSWQLVASELPWHRNGCVVLREDGTHYVVFGESPPLPGLGIASTRDFVNYTYINNTFLTPLGAGNAAEPEIVIEAGSTPVALSTGDYFHLYAAGTPGWVANGNYTSGWLVMDKDDPATIVQRSAKHLLVASEVYEGLPPYTYPVNRNRTIFGTIAYPLSGAAENGGQLMRVWFGAADANVATALINVTAKLRA